MYLVELLVAVLRMLALKVVRDVVVIAHEHSVHRRQHSLLVLTSVSCQHTQIYMYPRDTLTSSCLLILMSLIAGIVGRRKT